jgi:hypothetical protein
MRSAVSLSVVALVIASLVMPSPARAGCGCAKPPPPPAAIRPAATYAGAPVTIISSALREGVPYRVIFASGVSSALASVDATAVARRDLADGVVKPQLVVSLPSLPLGPVRVEVSDAKGKRLLAIADDQFTAVSQPVLLPEKLATENSKQRAAVGRDGTVYLSFDLSGVLDARTFTAVAKGLPLRFGTEDVVIYNVQGFLMQTLTNPVPGMFAFSATATEKEKNSDALLYFRHEFQTYFMDHVERDVHALDPTDPSWHKDGTRHVDHDHLIMAIAGAKADGGLFSAGATPEFTLSVAVTDG